jgi:hypothetical protein
MRGCDFTYNGYRCYRQAYFPVEQDGVIHECCAFHRDVRVLARRYQDVRVGGRTDE